MLHRTAIGPSARSRALEQTLLALVGKVDLGSLAEVWLRIRMERLPRTADGSQWLE